MPTARRRRRSQPSFSVNARTSRGRAAGAIRARDGATTRAGRAHLRTAVNVDTFGNVVDAIDDGCIEGCTTADEVITRHSQPAVHPDDTSGWIWRTVQGWVQGSGIQRNHVFMRYDGKGLLQ